MFATTSFIFPQLLIPLLNKLIRTDCLKNISIFQQKKKPEQRHNEILFINKDSFCIGDHWRMRLKKGAKNFSRKKAVNRLKIIRLDWSLKIRKFSKEEFSDDFRVEEEKLKER